MRCVAQSPVGSVCASVRVGPRPAHGDSPGSSCTVRSLRVVGVPIRKCHHRVCSLVVRAMLDLRYRYTQDRSVTSLVLVTRVLMVGPRAR